MSLGDYLIDQEGKDWQDLLSRWLSELPSTFDVWLVNRFGDLFLAFDDGSIHRVDVGGGSIKRIANNREEFCDLIDLGDNANDWLMIPLVDECVAQGLRLTDDQCYGFKLPPILGGEYSVDNVYPVNCLSTIRFSVTSSNKQKTFQTEQKFAS